MRKLPSIAEERTAWRRDAGLSLIEITISLALFTVGGLTMLGTMGSSMKLDVTNEQTARAVQAARSHLERMQTTEFRRIYATYNETKVDDPDGVGTAVGGLFEVVGLRELVEQGTVTMGKTIFPALETGELREDLDRPDLGFPRDLNGDGRIDDQNHSGDYVILPVLVDIRWQGASGERSVRFYTVLRP